MNIHPVATRLAAALAEAQISQEDLSERTRKLFPHAPVAQSTISRYVNHHYTPQAATDPRFWRTLRKLAVALGHPPTYFETPRPPGGTWNDRVYQERTRRNWSQEHLASAARTWLRTHHAPDAAFHQAVISRLEARADYRPTAPHITALCAVLGLTPPPPEPPKRRQKRTTQ